MPNTPQQIVVDPSGRSMVVDIFDARDDVSITCYDSLDGASAHTLPLTITDTTVFYLTAAGRFNVSVKVAGREIAGPAGAVAVVDVGQRVPVRLKPTLSAVELLAAAAAATPTTSLASTAITYDPTVSGMTATNVKAALDELDATVPTTSLASTAITYNPTVSGLTATNVKAALDEIVARVVDLETP